MRVGLARSPTRYDAFAKEIVRCGYDLVPLDLLSRDAWTGVHLEGLDALIYYPSFAYASSHPLALRQVSDQIAELSRQAPALEIYPDPRVIPYYGDKFRQYLFLQRSGLPTPKTVALERESDVSLAATMLGFPVVVKNRFGAGGDYVFTAETEHDLDTYYRVSNMNFGTWRTRRWLLSRILKRSVIRGFAGDREAYYPLLSAPLLAQEFVPHAFDLKTVVIKGSAAEFHWRRRASASMWKMNIDGGAAGEWSYVPPEPLDLSVALASKLGAKWLNTDLLPYKDGWAISEFSPVWHHYAYRESPALTYQQSYNGPIDAEAASNLERLIVRSLGRPTFSPQLLAEAPRHEC